MGTASIGIDRQQRYGQAGRATDRTGMAASDWQVWDGSIGEDGTAEDRQGGVRQVIVSVATATN